MTIDDANLLEFIRKRTIWLQEQPRDVEGALFSREQRDECTTLQELIREIARRY